jgi:hypothetical protein
MRTDSIADTDRANDRLEARGCTRVHQLNDPRKVGRMLYQILLGKVKQGPLVKSRFIPPVARSFRRITFSVSISRRHHHHDKSIGSPALRLRPMIDNLDRSNSSWYPYMLLYRIRVIVDEGPGNVGSSSAWSP